MEPKKKLWRSNSIFNLWPLRISNFPLALPCTISSLQTAACLTLIHPCLGYNPDRGIPSRDLPKADPDDGDRAETGGCEVFFLDGACPLTEQNILGKSGFFSPPKNIFYSHFCAYQLGKTYLVFL
jgi:hypothetical protein